MATNYESPFTFSSDPYANPFSNKRNAADTMDEDEDDDLKINAEKEMALEPTADVATSRQRKIAKFKQLQSKKSATGEQKSFTTATAKRGSQQRSNSLPRRNSNGDNGDDDDDDVQSKQPQHSNNKKEDEYIFFGQASAPLDAERREQQQRAQQNMDALNLEMSSSLQQRGQGNNKKKFDASSKRTDVASVEVHTMSYRSVRVPGHRMVHVRKMWKDICEPVVKQLKLQIRMNSKKNVVELRMVNVPSDPETHDRKHKNVIQKGSDFIRAVVIGFEIRDALALVRMDDIYLETFDIRDVKFFNKKSDHWMRAIGRVAGQYGKIKYSIENSTNTRVVIFGFKVYILGSFSSIRLARNAISRLIMGSAPGNVYAKLRVVSNRLKHKF